MRAALCLPLALAGGFAACILLAFGQSDPKVHAFAFYPPTADADPSVRHDVVVLMPSGLRVERTPERLSVGFDAASPRKVEITVGKRMTIGVKHEMRVYAEGDARPVDAGGSGYGSIPEPVPSDMVFLTGDRAFVNKAQGGIPTPGKRYVIEEEVSIFETDIPAQHFWSPTSKKYQVLWTDTLKTVR